jgi:GNAT superfamily N-acetyltransferase
MADDFDNLRRVTGALVKPAAVTVARAFQDYPVSVFFMPDAEKRRKRQPIVFRRPIRSAIATGEVYATSPKMEGVAVWFPSDARHGSSWQRLVSGELFASWFVSKKLVARKMAFSRYSSDVKKRVVPGRHWYLQILAVDPDFQGKGYASRLLRPMLARADREGVPCYLETQLAKNVDLYKHFGFRVAEEGTIPESNVYSWAMVRDGK